MKVNKHTENIWGIDKVLDIETCNDCISAAEGDNLFPVSIGDLADINITHENRVYISSSELANIIWSKISDIVPQQYGSYPVIGINTEFRFYKYLTTQKFERHQDIDFRNNNNEKSFYSLLIYLNDNFSGGETLFDEYTVKPFLGSALIFPHTLFHSGNIVTSGIKYVLRSDIMYKVE